MQDLANKRPKGECLTAHSFVTGLDYHDTKTTLRSGAGETGVFTMKRSSFTLAALMGLALTVAPAFAQQSQTMITDGIKPRPRVNIEARDIDSGKVIVVHVPLSLSKPHMVTFNEDNRHRTDDIPIVWWRVSSSSFTFIRVDYRRCYCNEGH